MSPGPYQSQRLAGATGRDVAWLKYLLLCSLAGRLHAVAALDNIGLEADGSRATVKLQEQTASIAKDGASFIASPERRCARAAVLADGLVMGEDGQVSR